jgi:hypothetical protein
MDATIDQRPKKRMLRVDNGLSLTLIIKLMIGDGVKWTDECSVERGKCVQPNGHLMVNLENL